MNPNIFKSIAAVSAGLITVIALSIVTDIAMETIGIFPPRNQVYPTGMLVLALLYRCLYGIMGGYVTAKLSPSNPVRHAVILGIIGTLISLMGAIVSWNLSANWYPVALVITALPCTWLGGRLWAGKNTHTV